MKKVLIYLSVLIILSYFVFLLFDFNFKSKDENLLSVYFLDVGQGDAIFIEAPNGNQILIDSGLDSSVNEELAKYLNWFDKEIDAVLMTHPDLDHIGGFPSILSSFHSDYFFYSEKHEENEVVKEIRKQISLMNGKEQFLKRGDKIFLDISNNIYLEVLFPDENFVSTDSNDGSIILKLIFDQTSILLTGDASQKVEKYLISISGDKLDSDILKVGHHGSNTSTGDDFLGLVSPQYAIISAGKDNSYGHPHLEAMDSLKKFNVEILETKNLATIVARSDGREIWFEY